MRSEMTKLPWTIDENSKKQWAIVGEGTAIAFIPKQHKNVDGNIGGIIAAVNGTYGIGIDPGAVDDVVKALDGLIDWCIQFTPEYPAVLLRAKEALDKAKIVNNG